MLLSTLTPIFGSLQKSQEIILLLNNAKPVIRHGYYDHELPQIERFCQHHSLHIIKSTFKVLLDDPHQFTNKGLRIPTTDPRSGMFFVYISQDEKAAHLALLAEVHNNHQQLGKLLGYPDCCITFFIQSFHEQNTNPQHPKTNPWTNLTLRHQDTCLLSHFPCSSDCTASIALAKEYFSHIQKQDQTYATQLLATLK